MGGERGAGNLCSGAEISCQSSPLNGGQGVITHDALTWGTPGYIMSLSRSCLGSEFIFVPTEGAPDVSEKV